MPIYPFQGQPDPRPIMCVSITQQAMQTEYMVAIIINAIRHYFGYEFTFHGALSKRHQRAFKELRFGHWEACLTTNMKIREAPDKAREPSDRIRESPDRIGEIASYHSRLVYFGKVCTNEYAPLGLSFANNLQPGLDKFDECNRVQKVLNIVTEAFNRNHTFRQIALKGWDAVFKDSQWMFEEFFWEDATDRITGLNIPKAWADTGICARGINEEAAGEMDVDSDDANEDEDEEEID